MLSAKRAVQIRFAATHLELFRQPFYEDRMRRVVVTLGLILWASLAASPGYAVNFNLVLGQACPANQRLVTFYEAEESKDAICSRMGTWEQWGIAGGGAMGGPGYKCSIIKKNWPTPLGGMMCTGDRAPNPVNVDLVKKFAPQLRFDRAAVGYPMAVTPFYNALAKDADGNPTVMPGTAPLGVENTAKTSLAGNSIPTYYQIRTFGNQVRIQFWWFYGYQHPCWQNEGSHNGDWERVMVTLKEDRSAIAAVTFWQHGGWYTRIAGPRDAPCTPGGTGRCGGSSGFESTSSTHPVVYTGKIAHGSYHDTNGSGLDTFDQCFYYGDFRNPASSADYLSTWSNVVDLDDLGEPWMFKDLWVASSRTGQGKFGDWAWGPDGISNHPTQHAPERELKACEGTSTYAIGRPLAVGCYKSECLAGDDQASQDCLKECEPGYDNAGLTCNKGKWPWEWKVYGRLTGGHKYPYPYTLPLGDAGLSRRRSNDVEWDLP
jgi:hypothetical protein